MSSSRSKLHKTTEFLTRQMYSSETVKLNREKFLNMTIDEKRKHYKCKDKYLTLDKIETWLAYYTSHKLETRKYDFDESLLSKKKEYNGCINEKIGVFVGDITRLEIDAIVNAAKKSLLGGGGVDGAIHSAAGRALLEECQALKGCNTGEAKETCAYNLPARHVIHTVGPIGEKPDDLRACYSNCLNKALEINCRSIAFPCISTGVYGYPNSNASLVALETVREFLEKNYESFDRVIFCLFMDQDIELYEKHLTIFFPIELSKPQDEKSDEESISSGMASLNVTDEALNKSDAMKSEPE